MLAIGASVSEIKVKFLLEVFWLLASDFYAIFYFFPNSAWYIAV